MGHYPTNVMATLLAKRGQVKGAPGDGTEYKMPLLGVDRTGFDCALVVVIASLNITTAAGDSTLIATVQDSATTTDGDFATYKDAITKTITATDTGVAEVMMVIPVNLKAAKKYIRVIAKVTSGDNSFTITADHALASCIILGGAVEKPDSAYDSDSYSDDDLSGVTA